MLKQVKMYCANFKKLMIYFGEVSQLFYFP